MGTAKRQPERVHLGFDPGQDPKRSSTITAPDSGRMATGLVIQPEPSSFVSKLTIEFRLDAVAPF